VGTNYTSQCGYDLVGREGVRLSEKWAEGLRTFHGLHSHSFPNCFFMGFTQSGFTTSVPHTLNEQSKHIAYILRHVVDHGIRSFEATQEAEDRWVGIIKSKAHLGARFYAECTPGYYNNEGIGSNDTGFLSGQYGDGPVAFFKVLDDWRAEGHLQGLALRAG
jgi:cyclohexanone monooxygenase